MNNDHRYPIRGASSPTLPLPADAWDSHTHVFGPFDQYPLAPDCRYQPPFAPRGAHLAAMNAAGFSRCVVVHASANGFDNRAVTDAVAHSAGRLHAVAVVPEDISGEELWRLHEAGVRGVRFTENGEFIGAPKPSGTLGLNELRRMAPRLRALGWYAQVWAKCHHLVASENWLLKCGLAVVVDHMGAFDVTLSVNDPTFARFVSSLEDGKIWVKLTSTRVSKLPWSDCADVRPFHDALVDKAPDRLIWGSDWPFIAMDNNLPHIGGLVDLFDQWTPDTALRQKIFVTNPKILFNQSS